MRIENRTSLPVQVELRYECSIKMRDGWVHRPLKRTEDLFPQRERYIDLSAESADCAGVDVNPVGIITVNELRQNATKSWIVCETILQVEANMRFPDTVIVEYQEYHRRPRSCRLYSNLLTARVDPGE